MKDYPQGDGNPDCKTCGGRGVVPVPKTATDPRERTQPCACVFVRDVAMNIERGWRGLLSAEPVSSSPLKGKDKMNLRVTGSRPTFRSHLKHVAARMSARWGFLVVTDADLMDAWLSRKLNVKDADVNLMRQLAEVHQYDALVDLIEPPALLILVCGVKAARNEAMPEVFLEALQHRAHLSKHTWVVDQPGYPLRDGHISYSYAVGEFLSEWPRVELKESSSTQVSTPPLTRPAPGKPRVSKPTEPVSTDLPEGPFTFDTESGPSPHMEGTRSMLVDTDGDLVDKKKRRR